MLWYKSMPGCPSMPIDKVVERIDKLEEKLDVLLKHATAK